MIDDELDDLLQAGIENRRRERGSKLNLLAHISLSNRLAAYGDLTFEELEYFAHKLSGYRLPDAQRLYHLDSVAEQVLARCEAERAPALAVNEPYEYPDWRTALCWFWPELDDVAALRRRVAGLEDDVANLEDQIANPEPLRDSKRWFEYELLAMTHSIFDKLSIEVADGQTVIGASCDRSIFLRAVIPRTFPRLTSTAWIDIQRDRFDRAPLRAAGGQANIQPIPWDKTLDVEDVKAAVAQATGKVITAAALGLEVQDDPQVYSLSHLKRLLRKKPNTLRISARGVLGAEILRNDILYEFFLRAAMA